MENKIQLASIILGLLVGGVWVFLGIIKSFESDLVNIGIIGLGIIMIVICILLIIETRKK